MSLESRVLHDDLQYDVLDDDVDDLDVLRVGGASSVSEDAPVVLLVHLLELFGEELDRRVIVVLGAVVLREIVSYRAVGQLFLEHVLLVEEQNHARFLWNVQNLLKIQNLFKIIMIPNLEPLVVHQELEQSQTLPHPIGVLILGQNLVVLADCRQEDEELQVAEAVDPLLPLTPLATDVDLKCYRHHATSALSFGQPHFELPR